MSDLPSAPPWDTEPVISAPVAVTPPAEAKPEKPPWVPSPDQQRAYDQILDWIDKKQKPVFTLGGLAGVGKTTLVGYLANDLMASMNVAFATPTGKAAQVLKRSLLKADVAADVTTIHSLLYRPIEDKKTGRVTGWSRRETVDADLIVVDEASMVSQEVLNDLTKLNRPILAVGDHGQLSPVGEDAGLMKNPDVRLEKIHRQAKGNPIIRLAHMVRNGAPDDVIRDFIEDIDDERVRWTRGWDEAVHFGKPPGFVLSHTNRLRRAMNIRIREQVFGYDEHDDPKVGETVICLKNRRLDDNGNMVPNGMRGTIVSEPRILDDHVVADVQFDEPVGLVEKFFMCRHQFLQEKTFAGFVDVPGGHRSWFTVGALVDYGYSQTVHKSVVEDTLIHPVGQKPKMIKDFVAGDIVKGVGSDGQVVDTRVVALHDHGMLMAFELEFNDGFIVRCTENHKFLTEEGQKPLHEIVKRNLEVICVDGSKEQWLESEMWPSTTGAVSNTRSLVRRSVVRASPLGLRKMYDLEVSHEQHNFVLPNGVVTSNSQGSSAPNVAVFIERSLGVLDEEERRRWKYTALTRAVDKVLLIF